MGIGPEESGLPEGKVESGPPGSVNFTCQRQVCAALSYMLPQYKDCVAEMPNSSPIPPPAAGRRTKEASTIRKGDAASQIHLTQVFGKGWLCHAT